MFGHTWNNERVAELAIAMRKRVIGYQRVRSKIDGTVDRFYMRYLVGGASARVLLGLTIAGCDSDRSAA